MVLEFTDNLDEYILKKLTVTPERDAALGAWVTSSVGLYLFSDSVHFHFRAEAFIARYLLMGHFCVHDVVFAGNIQPVLPLDMLSVTQLEALLVNDAMTRNLMNWYLSYFVKAVNNLRRPCLTNG